MKWKSRPRRDPKPGRKAVTPQGPTQAALMMAALKKANPGGYPTKKRG